MASRSSGPSRTEIGIVEGWFGENRIQDQMSETHIDVSVSGPIRVDQSEFVAIELQVNFPGTHDKMVELEIPVHKAKQLRETLDEILDEIDGP